MISTFFLTIFYLFLNTIVGFLPAGHLPAAITTALTYFVGVANSFSFIIPVDTLLQAALVILAFDGAMLLWYLINWVIKKIPGLH